MTGEAGNMAREILSQEHVSIRKLPINFVMADLSLFEHELLRVIPAMNLLQINDVCVNPDGILFRGSKILSESFHFPYFYDTSGLRAMAKVIGRKALLKFLARNCLFRRFESIERNVIWCTDDWSHMYFHWITDSLPRLITFRENAEKTTLILPGAFQKKEYVKASLKPFMFKDITYINKTFKCKHLEMSSHCAPSGNYNDILIKTLRNIYTEYYQREKKYCRYGNKIYISRGKAFKRKITNEEECIKVLEAYGFKTIYFEDHPFEQQVKIALNTRYLVSNHGAGLTNMLFMQSEGSVLELRRKGDSHNNCFFTLASALDLKYYYQLCNPKNLEEDSHTANLSVDCRLLRELIELMLAN